MSHASKRQEAGQPKADHAEEVEILDQENAHRVRKGGMSQAAAQGQAMSHILLDVAEGV
jgi:hypothetical protein